MAVNPAGAYEADFVAEAGVSPPQTPPPVTDNERTRVWSAVYSGDRKTLDQYQDRLARLGAEGADVSALLTEKSEMYRVADKVRVESLLERADRELGWAVKQYDAGNYRAHARSLYEAHDSARAVLEIIKKGPLYDGRVLADKLEAVNEILATGPHVFGIIVYWGQKYLDAALGSWGWMI